MTERTGGSDVSRTETVARLGKDGNYYLNGYKFFTSASTSEATVLLARIEDENGNSVAVNTQIIFFNFSSKIFL